MTIAIGFNFDEGVLLCADTQFTGGSVKIFDSKMFRGSILDLRDELMEIAVAMSGTDGYMQLAIEKCYSALADYAIGDDGKPSGHIDRFGIRDAISEALIEFYKKHIFEHKLYGYQDGPHVELLFAIRLKEERAVLYWTNETTVNICDDAFKCVGSGAAIAAHTIKPLYRNPDTDDMPLSDTILLATHALKVTKDSDPYCGGDSEFAVIYDSGEMEGVARYDISQMEEYSSIFSDMTRKLFYAGADLSMSDDELYELMLDYSMHTTAIREQQAEDLKKRKKLEQKLSKGARK